MIHTVAKFRFAGKQTISLYYSYSTNFTLAGKQTFFHCITRKVSKFAFAGKQTISLHYSYSVKVRICRKTDPFIVLLVQYQSSHLPLIVLLIQGKDLPENRPFHCTSRIVPTFTFAWKQTLPMFFSYSAKVHVCPKSDFFNLLFVQTLHHCALYSSCLPVTTRNRLHQMVFRHDKTIKAVIHWK